MAVADVAAPGHTYSDTGLTAATTYSYALFAHDARGNQAVAVTVTTQTKPADTTAPGPVTNATATPGADRVTLAWTDPTDTSFSGVMIRRSTGALAPSSPTAGTLVTDTAKAAVGYTDTGLAAGTQFSSALFAHDGAAHYALPATVTATTTSAPGSCAYQAVQHVSGTIATDTIWAPTARVCTSSTPAPPSPQARRSRSSRAP